MSHLSHNRVAWNRLAEVRSQFTKVATDEECHAPLQTLDSRGWLPESVTGQHVLCLASGGGWQSILYASAGAQVTVVDLSNKMLQLDEQEARRRGLQVKIVETSMDDLSDLRDAQFDIVHQPVSTCYVPDVEAVYREVARVLRPGGLYISQHKTPTSLQITSRNQQNDYVVGLEYYQQGALPKTDDRSYREDGATEYLHRWDQLVGGLCRQGFVIEDLREPVRADPNAPVGHFRHRGRFVAPYVRIKARRIEQRVPAGTPAAIWVP
ncbi:MAG: SAM-dependent methyltransferase [Gimesia sp.]|jgi:ubiquinone/menaquinone biosynthesis C-methylase UbiE|uniref:Class I SAM-dependent methyltransferase n=1 Tax=Gimesia maris TaxID=122 RepID=A0A3D3R248_9PLAN|nr:SAM-dependent methyltransferase [Gimesia sp.]HCO22162.1 class I SAM-dependent methyltransferase [Gimesia maris]|tara:strand:- start:20684 stop:21481 length:798 start_codon:yes stop_codon:yes gene_type:complete